MRNPRRSDRCLGAFRGRSRRHRRRNEIKREKTHHAVVSSKRAARRAPLGGGGVEAGGDGNGGGRRTRRLDGAGDGKGHAKPKLGGQDAGVARGKVRGRGDHFGAAWACDEERASKSLSDSKKSRQHAPRRLPALREEPLASASAGPRSTMGTRAETPGSADVIPPRSATRSFGKKLAAVADFGASPVILVPAPTSDVEEIPLFSNQLYEQSAQKEPAEASPAAEVSPAENASSAATLPTVLPTMPKFPGAATSFVPARARRGEALRGGGSGGRPRKGRRRRQGQGAPGCGGGETGRSAQRRGKKSRKEALMAARQTAAATTSKPPAESAAAKSRSAVASSAASKAPGPAKATAPAAAAAGASWSGCSARWNPARGSRRRTAKSSRWTRNARRKSGGGVRRRQTSAERQRTLPRQRNGRRSSGGTRSCSRRARSRRRRNGLRRRNRRACDVFWRSRTGSKGGNHRGTERSGEAQECRCPRGCISRGEEASAAGFHRQQPRQRRPRRRGIRGRDGPAAGQAERHHPCRLHRAAVGARVEGNATPTQRAMAPPSSAEFSYQISPYRENSDSEDEDGESRRPRKPVPSWAPVGCARPVLRAQAKVDPDDIFPNPSKTCSLDAVFTGHKSTGSGKSRRSSSGNWFHDRLTWKEELTYKREMGFVAATNKQ